MRGIHRFHAFAVSVEAYESLQEGMQHAVVARKQSKAIVEPSNHIVWSKKTVRFFFLKTFFSDVPILLAFSCFVLF